jgi:hypothetical protein
MYHLNLLPAGVSIRQDTAAMASFSAGYCVTTRPGILRDNKAALRKVILFAADIRCGAPDQRLLEIAGWEGCESWSSMVAFWLMGVRFGEVLNARSFAATGPLFGEL